MASAQSDRLKRREMGGVNVNCGICYSPWGYVGFLGISNQVTCDCSTACMHVCPVWCHSRVHSVTFNYLKLTLESCHFNNNYRSSISQSQHKKFYKFMTFFSVHDLPSAAHWWCYLAFPWRDEVYILLLTIELRSGLFTQLDNELNDPFLRDP